MMLNGVKKKPRRKEAYRSMNTDEKPWILHFNSRGDTIQIDQDEYEALIQDLKDDKTGATLKDGSYINLRIASIVANEHYISPESIERTRKKRAHWEEYQDLKKQGILTTQKEYIEWKKESIKKQKAFQESLKENEDEKKR